MVDLKIDNLDRDKARETVFELPRGKEFLVHILNDGRKVFIVTEGKKQAKINANESGIHDFKVHFEGETTKLNYIDDFLADILQKKLFIGENAVEILISAIKSSIELMPVEEIYKKYPKLKELEKKKLPGHSIEFLLVIIKWMALQEDVNYWGINPKTKKHYEGRNKPYNALYDFFIKKEPLYTVIKKHRFFF